MRFIRKTVHGLKYKCGIKKGQFFLSRVDDISRIGEQASNKIMAKSTIHRIVTHHNSEGKSAILLDEFSELRPGFASEARVIWQSHEAPASLDGHEDLADELAPLTGQSAIFRFRD
jgi:hypothetical protein